MQTLQRRGKFGPCCMENTASMEQQLLGHKARAANRAASPSSIGSSRSLLEACAHARHKSPVKIRRSNQKKQKEAWASASLCTHLLSPHWAHLTVGASRQPHPAASKESINCQCGGGGWRWWTHPAADSLPSGVDRLARLALPATSHQPRLPGRGGPGFPHRAGRSLGGFV